MNRSTILLLIFLAVVGVSLYLKKKFSAQTPALYTVVITEEGFTPSKIVIAKGDIVRWVNRGERDHWPASNYHPTHNLYPEAGGCLGSKFDACHGLKKEEEYSFKFEKLGEWPVHDHLFPSLLMTVEVVKERTSLSKPAFVFNKNTKVEEFRKFNYSDQLEFIKNLSLEAPNKAWDYLKKAFIVDGQVMGNAHEFAHVIGNGSYRKSGLEGIKICDKAFAFGCFHGVTEAMLLKEGPSRIKEIETGCLKAFPPQKTQDYTGCIHGTGHGIYTWEKGDMNRALLDCDIISEPYRQYCYDGVFMENSTESTKQAFNPKNPWKFCTNLAEQYHRNCARYQSQIFLRNQGAVNSEKTVGLLCSQAPSTLLEETCYQSLGFYIAQNSMGNEDKIVTRCAGMPNKKGEEICLMGGATETTFQKYEGYTTVSPSLCKRIKSTFKNQCLNNIGTTLEVMR